MKRVCMWLMGLILLAGGTTANAQEASFIAYGESVQGEIRRAMDQVWSFNGCAGDVVTVTLESEEFDPYLELYGPDLRLLREDNDGGDGTGARIDAYTLPASGTYSVVAAGYTRDGQGAYTLALAAAGYDGTGTAITLRPGESVEGEVTSLLGEVWQFAGCAGDVVTLTLESAEFDAYLEIYGSDVQAALAEDNDSGDGTDARIDAYTLPESGIFTAVAAGRTRTDRGAYTLTLRINREPRESESRPGTATPAATPTPTPAATPTPTIPPTPTATPTEPGPVESDVAGISGLTLDFELAGPDENVLLAGFSPDGRFVATVSRAGMVKVWGASSGEQILALEVPSALVMAARFSPDSRQIATAGSDGKARIWDLQNGAELQVLDVEDGLVFGADFAPAAAARLVTGGSDGVARVWNLETGEVVRSLEGHDGPIFAAAFSPDGQQIVTGSEDATARLWRTSDGTELHVLDGHDNAVLSAEFSPDGNRLVTAGADGRALVWDADEGSELFALGTNTDIVYAASFSPDGERIVAAATGRIRIWDSQTGARLYTSSDEDDLLGSTVFYAAGFSPDGTRLVTASEDGTAKLWWIDDREADAPTGTPAPTLVATPAPTQTTPSRVMPTATGTPGPTGTPSPTPLATAVPGMSQSLCTVVSSALNMRPGPGIEYTPPLRVLPRGTQVQPLARNEAGTWIYGELVDAQVRGWVSAGGRYVACDLAIGEIPVIGSSGGAPTPTPTPTPAPTQPPATQAPGTTGLITGFEDFGTWVRGDEPWGTFVPSDEQVYSGNYSGKFEYRFPAGEPDNYLVYRRILPISGRPAALSTWVYGDGAGNFLNAWLLDANGQIWQFTFGRVTHTGWQEMVAPLNLGEGWPNHAVGDADAQEVAYPLALYALVVDGAERIESEGFLYVDELRAVE